MLNYKWKINGQYRWPTESELEEAIDKVSQQLYAEDTLAQAHLGHLIVQRDGEHMDVYLHVGSTS